MRIISGRYRGKKLADFTALGIRPTSDRAKVSLFNIISSQILGSTVLDLFCGSGGLGLECVSRGAYRVCFNDSSPNSIIVLNRNIADLKVQDVCEVTKLDYKTYLARCTRKFDLIFLDPPYAEEYGVTALNIIAERGLLNKGGIAVYERDRPFTYQVAGLQLYDERKYGKAYLSFFRKV